MPYAFYGFFLVEDSGRLCKKVTRIWQKLAERADGKLIQFFQFWEMLSWVIEQKPTSFLYIFLLGSGKLLANWVKNVHGFQFTGVTKNNSTF